MAGNQKALDNANTYLCSMHDLKLWKFINQKLESGQPVMLMCVVESKGSSPGRSGFKMAVTADNMCGSIGGGIMEHKFVEMAKERLKMHDGAFVKKQFHRKTEAQNQSGMICSGEQTVLLYRLDTNILSEISRLVSSLEKNENGLLKITNRALKFLSGNEKEDLSFKMTNETDFVYEEPVGFRNHLHIIGGGHCALALSRLMHGLDFYISIYEDRNDLNTFLENNFVQNKILVNDYSELKDLILQSDGSYSMVMTFGYRTDDAAVRALAGKKFKYFGVLGSSSKMQQMFREWRASGLPDEWLDKIYSPAGMQINSETPEEIAVSIAAQIIQIKNSSR